VRSHTREGLGDKHLLPPIERKGSKRTIKGVGKVGEDTSLKGYGKRDNMKKKSLGKRSRLKRKRASGVFERKRSLNTLTNIVRGGHIRGGISTMSQELSVGKETSSRKNKT